MSLRDAAIRRLQALSVARLVRFACWVALVGLAVMVAPILYPLPLIIIFSMSVGQVIGMVAVLCYGLSVLADVVRGTDHPPDAPGPARPFRTPASDDSASSGQS